MGNKKLKRKNRSRQSQLRPCNRRGDHGLTTEGWESLHRGIGPALEAAKRLEEIFRSEVEQKIREIEDRVSRTPQERGPRVVVGPRGEILPVREIRLPKWFEDQLKEVKDPEIRKLAQDRAAGILTDAAIRAATGQEREK